IARDDTAGSLAPKLSAIGAELMLVALSRLQAGALVETPPDNALATLAPMLDKDAGRIDWAQPAAPVAHPGGGVDPWPGAHTQLAGETLKLWRAATTAGRGAPGEILAADKDAVIVACGEGAVAILELQLPGRKRLGVQAFLAGRPLAAGTRLG